MDPDVEDIYELSPLQRGMLLHSVVNGDADMYVGQHAYTVEGPLDVDALIRAWQLVFAAHPALRTSFYWEDLDKPLQVVHRDVTPAAHQCDWSGLDEAEQQKRLEGLLADDRTQGFDLTKAPLQRLYLARLGPDRHALAWSHHHLLMDGWSTPIFMNDVMARYRSLTAEVAPPPSAPPYRDYIAWLQRQDMSAAQRFWTDLLAGVSPCHLAPLRAAGPQPGTGAVDRITMDMPTELEHGLRAAAARHNVTLSALLQAAWAVVLRRYTGASQVTFGCVTSGRPADLPQVDRIVGPFVNTLPVPVTVPDDGDLGSWLRELQTRHAHIRQYEFSPLADIKKWAGMPGQPLFESLLVLANYSFAVHAGELGDTLTVRAEARYDKVSVPLSLVVVPEPVSELQLVIHRNRFDAGFADELLTCLRSTLTALIDADGVEPVVKAAGPPVSPAMTGREPARPRMPAEAPTPPATPQEEAIAAVYKEILGIEDIDVTRSFFELGGDSFDAVRAIGRIDGATVTMLATNPSVRDLARALTEAAAGQPDTSLDEEIAELERQLAETAELEQLVAGSEARERIAAERAALERQLAERRAAKERPVPPRPGFAAGGVPGSAAELDAEIAELERQLAETDHLRPQLASFYTLGEEEERLAASGHGQLEFERTKEILLRQLPPAPAVIADIGGGPGRYALWLAELGYRVVHRDIVPLHVEQLRSVVGPGAAVESAVGDARSLDLADESVAAVLLLGPLYHLPRQADRLQALREARRIVKPGGPVFAAALSRWAARLDGVLRDRLYERGLEMLDLLDSVERTGVLPSLARVGYTAYLHLPRELQSELRSAGLDVADLVSVEGAAFLVHDLTERMADPRGRQAILAGARAHERVPELLGLGPHMVATGLRA